MTTTNRSKFLPTSLSDKVIPSVLHPGAFYKQRHFKIRQETRLTYTFTTSTMYKRSHQVNWDHAPKFIDWYPSKTQDKRDSYCCTGSGEIPYPEMILMVVVVSFWCSIVICACVAICSPNHPVINNDFNMMSLQQSTQSRPFLMSSMTTVQNMNTANLNLIEPTPRNSIVSTEQPPPECNNYNIRVATTNEIEQLIPDAPPAYDALVQSNSTTIIIEQHNLPPPTYDDFIRKNNAKWRKMNNF